MDDLLDLDWAKQPAKSAAAQQQQPPRNGASPAWSAGSSGARGGVSSSSAYNFDVLTRAMPTNTAQRPSGASAAPQKPTTKPLSSGDDAFSSLLGFGGSGNAANGGGAGTTLSMAERLRQQNSTFSSSPTGSAQASAGPASPSAWDGLDNLGASSVASKPPPTRAAAAPKQPKNGDALWVFSTPAAASKPATRATPPVASARAAEAPDAAKASKDSFDFAEFEDPGAFQSSALGGGGGGAGKAAAKKKPPQSTSLFDTSDTFDDGDGDGDDDDDLLGELGKRPARPLASTFEHAQERREPPKPAASTRAGAASPPPHILGQVVEMGFSPQQAREALARTGSGQDVQAALEMLLQSSGHNSANGRETPQQTASRRGARQGTAEGEESDRRLAMRLQREEQERHGGGGGGGGPRWQQTGNHAKHDADSRAGTPDWQKQADQLYAQASELGANVFSKANSLWATAKSQAQRALEEHTASAAGSSAPSSGRASPATASDRARSRRWAVPSRDGGGGSGGGARQGKPKWMIDAGAAEEAEGAEPTKTDRQGGFRDDDDDDVQEAPPFVTPAARKTREEARVMPARTEGESGKAPSNANLWGGDDVQRRPSPVATQAATATAPSARGGMPSQQQQQRRNGQTAAPAAATRPATLRTRRLVADDAGAVQSAMQQKERGNALYKRGAYGEAEAAYTAALAAMEGNAHSVRRVVLYNNRANARLKNGDAKGALDDTMAVLRLIVVDEHGKGSPFVLFRPSQESALPLPDYADVNLREGYAKALLRRAQAEELLERWDPALSVWSLLGKYEREEGSGQNGVANMRAAEQGKGRCSKMLKGGDVGSAPVPRVRAAATRAVAKAEAQAKERIRSENAAAAAEEAEKDGLRDSVDARVVAWRTGKENNVRALLASLHDVVWPGLAWKRVGMHELVMEKQVKIVYMRAIGKLHPDKLTPKANTLEERMLGGAVFSVLNDAWSAAQA